MSDDSYTPPPVFVISLVRSTARREVIAARLTELGLPYTFFDAVVGAELDLATHPAYARRRRRLFFGRDLSNGEMGCLLSHRALYQHMLDADIKTALILEDDAILDTELPAVIAALQKSPVRWNLIRFLAREKVYRNSRTICPLVGKYMLTRPLGTPGGAYGYLLDQTAARQLLKRMKRNWLPVDIVHGRFLNTGLSVYAVSPSPIQPDDDVPSTIGEARFNKKSHLTGWEAAVYPATRFIFKISDFFHKRISAAMSWPQDRLTRKRLGS